MLEHFHFLGMHFNTSIVYVQVLELFYCPAAAHYTQHTSFGAMSANY